MSGAAGSSLRAFSSDSARGSAAEQLSVLYVMARKILATWPAISPCYCFFGPCYLIHFDDKEFKSGVVRIPQILLQCVPSKDGNDGPKSCGLCAVHLRTLCSGNNESDVTPKHRSQEVLVIGEEYFKENVLK